MEFYTLNGMENYNGALKAKANQLGEVILFNLSGHGLLDMGAYENYL